MKSRRIFVTAALLASCFHSTTKIVAMVLRQEPSTTTSAKTNSKIAFRESFDQSKWIRLFSTVKEEKCYEITDTSFPKDIRGTFFQNGGSKFQVGEEIVIHPFDADGMISAITFDNGKAWFRNRYVRTPGFLKEQEKPTVSQRGVFGTMKNKGKWWSNIFDVSFKEIANTGVLFRKGKLYALWEAALPYEIDPVTLDTIGKSDLDGSLADQGRWSAHYRVDSTSGNIANFAVLTGTTMETMDPNKAHILALTEHDENLNLVYSKQVKVPGFGLAHDCGLTENYFCFLQTNVKFDPIPLLLGQKGVGELITRDEDRKMGRLVLIRRGAEAEEPRLIDIPPYFAFHICNAHEDGDLLHFDAIIADEIKMADDARTEYPTLPLWESTKFETMVPGWRLARITVNTNTGQYISTADMSTNASRNVEFPVINPNYEGKQYQYAYVIANGSKEKVTPIQGLGKVDVKIGEMVQKWLPEEHQYLQELQFIPKSSGNDVGEDSGYLMGYMIDTAVEETYFVIFDASDVSRGPISQSLMENHLCTTLHGSFVPDFVPRMSDCKFKGGKIQV